MFGDAFRDKTVWLSGHTGFKGSWLAEWLLRLGARVHGYALEPVTSPALFEQLGLAGRIASHQIADVRDSGAVRDSLLGADPDFVFHLAAQPLVRLSYAQPVETYTTNVMGTVHVLDALRGLRRPCAAVIVTTDKCYENKEWVHGYRETDPMGGHDPYSSSKGAAEIAVASWRASFFDESSPVAIASARAGNVIGGGDWALDRIVPDCMRSLAAGQPIPVRNRFATRPWQHVLEPLGGYLWLAAALARPERTHQSARALRGAFNFGPGPDSNRSVGELVVEILRHWPGKWVDNSDPNAVHEASLLQLSIDKAHALLRWTPAWDFAETVRQTVEWYRQDSALERTAAQIDGYAAAAREKDIPWARS
jgi:CDP-glucose 4,6-dehydratase